MRQSKQFCPRPKAKGVSDQRPSVSCAEVLKNVQVSSHAAKVVEDLPQGWGVSRLISFFVFFLWMVLKRKAVDNFKLLMGLSMVGKL